jgi:hypothetical protein
MFRHYQQNGHAWLDTSAPPISLGTIDLVPSVQCVSRAAKTESASSM